MEIKRPEKLIGNTWCNYLGRRVRRIEFGWQMCMKEGYFEQLLSENGLLNSKPVNSPCWTENTSNSSSADRVPLSANRMTNYRSAVGKLSWSLCCRPELAYVCKELAKQNQLPCELDSQHLKRVLRFVAGTLHVVLELTCDHEGQFDHPWEHVDSSWAPKPSCRSTSGMVLAIDGFHLSTGCKTQAVVALSSCEAELLSTNHAATEGLFLCHVLQELGFEPVLHIYTDSSSNLAILSKRGVGRMRHLEAKTLWLQDQLRDKAIVMHKIASEDNLADIFTKHLSPKPFQKKMCALGLKDLARSGTDVD